MSFKILEYLYYLVEIIRGIMPKKQKNDKKIIVEVTLAIIFVKE